MSLQQNRGFTLVELLIVIVVIAILAAVTIIAYNGIQEKAKFSKMSQDLAAIRKGLELYKVANDGYPNSGSCVDVDSNYQFNWCGWNQGTNNSFIPGLSPTYIREIPHLDTSLDGTNTYLYRSSDSTNGSGNGTTYYELIRYNSAGLSNVEKSSSNPNQWFGSGYDGIAWGFKSDPSLSNW